MNYRHLSLQPAEQRPFAGQGQLWLPITADKSVRIRSDTGTYYLPSQDIHEHTGQIMVAHNGPAIAQVQFVVFTWQFDPLATWLTSAPPPKYAKRTEKDAFRSLLGQKSCFFSSQNTLFLGFKNLIPF